MRILPKRLAASRVEVYLGGATRFGVPLDAACFRSWQLRVADVLAGFSGGGVTIHAPAEGRWLGRPEPTVVVEAFLLTHQFDAVLTHSVFESFLAATSQQAVLVVVDGQHPWLLEDDDTHQER